MGRTLGGLLLILLLLAGTPWPAGAADLSADALALLKQNEGEFVSVVGVVALTHIARSGKVRYLNLGRDCRNDFAVVIFTTNLDKFTAAVGEPTRHYLHKKVRVQGRLTIYKDRPEIIARSPEQITVLAD